MSAFPPSSPLVGHHEHDVDDPFSSFSGPSTAPKKLVISTPFSKQSSSTASKPQVQAYPTPNPSSSIGRSSSPARHQTESPLPRSESNASADEHEPSVSEEEHQQEQLQLQPPQQIANDDASIEPSTLTTKPSLNLLLYPDEKISIGRSSRCDYFLKSKFASREHIKLHYDLKDNELTVLCKGYNGVKIHFGFTQYGYVDELEDNVFSFVKKSKDEVTDDEEIVDVLAVLKNEQLTVPYNDRMSLEVKGTFMSVTITNEESETEDEMPVLKKRLSSIEPTEQMKNSSLPEIIQQKETTVIVAPAPHTSKAIDTLQTPLNKPIKPLEFAPLRHLSRSSTPVLKSSVSMDTPTLQLDNDFERVQPVDTELSSIKRTLGAPHLTHQGSKSTDMQLEAAIRVPLQQRSRSDLNKQQINQRRRKAESGNSPQKKKPDTKQQLAAIATAAQEPRQKIENLNLKEILATIADFETIQNLLSNHLAFSRLSQTPLKQLQSISGSTQALTRQQLRAILASTEWIGVIYRKGKDAAGNHLDEEYYYDVEHDQDTSRVQLVSSIKGSSGLRNCRKTHKQYFWKKPVSRK